MMKNKDNTSDTPNDNKDLIITELDYTMYKQLLKIHESGYLKVHSAIELPTYFKTLEDHQLITIDFLSDKYRQLFTIKTIVRIYISTKGLNFIRNYERKRQIKKERYIKDQIEAINNLDLTSDEKAQITLLLNLLLQTNDLEEINNLKKTVLKTVKKNNAKNLLYSVISSVIANMITGKFI